MQTMPHTSTKPVGQNPAPVQTVDPIAELEQEHALAMEHIRFLEDAARSIRERGFTAASFQTIAEKSVLLGEIFRDHDGIEEKYLFPVVEKFAPEYIREFREEHRTTRRLFTTLRSLVHDLEQGRIHGSSVGDLLRTTQDIVLVLRRHIIGENDILFPLLRQRLDRSEVEALKNTMREVAGRRHLPGGPNE